MILQEIFCVVSRFPQYISCYIAENRLPLGQCMKSADTNNETHKVDMDTEMQTLR